MWSHPARNFFGAWVLACVEVQRAVAAPERLGLAGTTSTCAAGAVVYNDTGCTTAGHYVETSAIDADDCCGQCGSDERCFGWTFHEPTLAVGTALETPDNSGKCDMSDQPRVKHGVAGATCGCRTADCEPAPTSCVPVPRPGPSERAPLPAGISQPVNLVSILIDDLGYADTSVTGNSGVDFTPNMQALQEAGIQLGRHHTYLWCSPSRRSFLTGRYPVHISGEQAPLCSNLMPLQYRLLSEKLAVADYQSVFLGKGHLGYRTTDHLPGSRGFTTHIGYLDGGESYRWGGRYGSPEHLVDVSHFDMWHNNAPADKDLVGTIDYSTNFYAQEAVRSIRERNESRPLWLHVAFQAVHTGNWRQDVPPQDAVPAGTPALDKAYASATRAVDDAIGNITAALVDEGIWNNTFILVTSDNGGDCGLPDQPNVTGQPGSCNNFPLLGRKCTAFEGGTRVAAYVSGGIIPPAQRGTTANKSLMYITDWYPTFCALAGVDPTDDWLDPTTNLTHAIDGLNLWPYFEAGDTGELPQLREYLPTTERSLLWDNGEGRMYKLIVDEFKSNRFYQNGTQYMDTENPCISSSSGLSAWGANAAVASLDDPGLRVPPSCTVCSTSSPCLFEVIADPLEKNNLAAHLPNVTAMLLQKLSSYVPYVPADLTPEQLACYNCTAAVTSQWGRFVGPCCQPPSPTQAHIGMGRVELELNP